MKDLTDSPFSDKTFISGPKGYYRPDGKSKYLGIANFTQDNRTFKFKDNKEFYLFKPKGDKAQVAADLFPPRKDSDLCATPAYMSNGKPSLLCTGQNSPTSAGKNGDNPKTVPFFGSKILRTANSYLDS